MPKNKKNPPNVFLIIRKSNGYEIRVKAQKYCGEWRIDIRNYFKSDKNEMKPTRRGIVIKLCDAKKFRRAIKEAAEACRDAT